MTDTEKEAGNERNKEAIRKQADVLFGIYKEQFESEMKALNKDPENRLLPFEERFQIASNRAVIILIAVAMVKGENNRLCGSFGNPF